MEYTTRPFLEINTHRALRTNYPETGETIFQSETCFDGVWAGSIEGSQADAITDLLVQCGWLKGGSDE